MIYFLQRSNGDIKIGYAGNFDVRLAQLERQYGELVPLGFIGGDMVMESALHRVFAPIRVKHEWFEAHETLMSYIANFAQDTPYIQYKGDLTLNIPNKGEGEIVVKNGIPYIIRLILEQNEITQMELSAMLKIDHTLLSRYLSGKREPRLVRFDVVYAICRQFKITPNDVLLWRKDSDFAHDPRNPATETER